jgi:hypothetical protein
VLLATEAEAERAVRTLSAGGRREMKGRPVAFSLACRGEVYSHLAAEERRGLGLDGDYEGVLRARGWPFSVSAGDIMGFFDGYALSDPHIVFCRRPDGRFSGETYVVFGSVEDAQRAQGALHNAVFKERKIELFPAFKGEAVAAMGGAWLARPDQLSQDVLFLRGIPFTASPDEVAAFLGEHAVPTSSEWGAREERKGAAAMQCGVPCAELPPASLPRFCPASPGLRQELIGPHTPSRLPTP